MMSQSPPSRKPQLKKRHTKPCKFFQNMKCPLPAEACDFAHVLAVPAVSQCPAPCRYYLAGHCHNGSSCRFRHGHEGAESESIQPPQAHVAYSPPTRELPNGFRGDPAVYAEGPPVYASYVVPVYPPWPSYSTVAPHSAYPTNFPGPPSAPAYMSSARSRDSTCSSNSTTLSTSEPEELVYGADDPQYVEHSHSPQSRIRVYETTPPVHIPPVYPSLDPNVAMPVPMEHAKWQSLSPPRQSPSSPNSRSQSRSASRHKATKFKTKPCKYYQSGNTCPAGDLCTFIHDEPGVPWPLVIPQQKTKYQASIPPKPQSAREDCSQKGFFPIPWRVIGGGVLMGSTKDDDDFPEGSAKHDSSTAPPAGDTLPLPSTSNVRSTVGEMKRAHRARSNSIPPTPSTAHVNVDALFSAESPGGL